MNAQHFFDKTVSFIRKQGRASLSHDNVSGTCAYRGTDGARCAAGVHIKDSEYSFEMEGNGIQSLLDHRSLDKSHILAKMGDLAQHLQIAHDQAAVTTRAGGSRDGSFLSHFERRIRAVAKMHSLVYTPPAV